MPVINEIWAEKYRPKTLDEFIGQEEVVKRIKAFLEKRTIPHLLFAGPPGTGKTTLALIIARTLLGERWRDNFLELNASDERGIATIREKVKDFARTAPVGNAPFKIIFLDEADALTRDAQQALRRIMEKYSGTCRFILSCNYSSKIIDPIQSRCAIFRFKPFTKEDIKKILMRIVEKEKLKVDPEAIEAIAEISEGDARRAINILQAAAAAAERITRDIVYEVASVAKPEEIKEILQMAFEGKFIEARDKLVEIMLNYGLSGVDVLKQIASAVWSLPVDNDKKIDVIDKIGEIEFRMIEGSNPHIQLNTLLAYIAKLGAEAKKTTTTTSSTFKKKYY